jgi:hypothetical protein
MIVSAVLPGQRGRDHGRVAFVVWLHRARTTIEDR